MIRRNSMNRVLSVLLIVPVIKREKISVMRILDSALAYFHILVKIALNVLLLIFLMNRLKNAKSQDCVNKMVVKRTVIIMELAIKMKKLVKLHANVI